MNSVYFININLLFSDKEMNERNIFFREFDEIYQLFKNSRFSKVSASVIQDAIMDQFDVSEADRGKVEAAVKKFLRQKNDLHQKKREVGGVGGHCHFDYQ